MSRPMVVITHWADPEVAELLESVCTVVPNHSREALPRSAVVESGPGTLMR